MPYDVAASTPTDTTGHGLFEDDWYGVADTVRDQDRAVYERVRDWAVERVRPGASERWEQARFDRDLLAEMVDLEVVGGTLRDHGGPGLSATASHLVGTALASVDGSMCTAHGVHSSLAIRSIDRLGSDEQRARWLPRMTSMEVLGAFALTEPDHGSDVVQLATRAERDGDGWVLTGRKRWIGHGDVADVVVVWARDDEGQVGGFVVDHSEADGHPVPGFTADRMTGKAALRAVWQAEPRLDGVRVPAANRLLVTTPGTARRHGAVGTHRPGRSRPALPPCTWRRSGPRPCVDDSQAPPTPVGSRAT